MFDKKRFTNNCKQLLKERNIKLSKLDEEVNKIMASEKENKEDEKNFVGNGYYGKLFEKDDVIPAVDKVVALAKVLGVSIGSLIEGDVSNETTSEKELSKFLELLTIKTTSSLCSWKREIFDYDEAERRRKILFNTEKKKEEERTRITLDSQVELFFSSLNEKKATEWDGDSLEHVGSNFYTSPMFNKDQSLCVYDSCYQGTFESYIFVTEITKNKKLFFLCEERDNVKEKKEIYELYLVDTAIHPLSASYSDKSVLHRDMSDLFNAIKENSQHIFLDKEAMDYISSFLKNGGQNEKQ